MLARVVGKRWACYPASLLPIPSHGRAPGPGTSTKSVVPSPIKAFVAGCALPVRRYKNLQID